MKDLSAQQILAYGLVIILLIATIWILFITPPCNGNYHFALGGEKYLIFDCDNGKDDSGSESIDPCATIKCPRGQSCKDGVCVTNPIPDPCANIKCKNGGTCRSGTCHCPDGYTGTYCEIKTETEANIRSTTLNWGRNRGGINVSSSSFGKSGSNWSGDIISNNYLPANAAGKIVHTINTTKGEYAIGFNNSQSSTMPKDLDYGLQFMQEGSEKLAVYDAVTTAKIKTVYVGDTVTIEKRKDGTVLFLHNGAEFNRLSGASGKCMYLDVKVKTISLQTSSFLLEGGWFEGGKCSQINCK